MRILSIRGSFDADHSSSTYEFFALERLTREQRAAIEELTGEPGRRHLQFHYWGDRTLPSGWRNKLLSIGYDILVTESYDWWGVELSLPHDPALVERLEAYRCDSDGNGLDVSVVDDRTIVYFGMQLDYDAGYDTLGEDPFEGLADLFEGVREGLLAGDMSAAWATYQVYGAGEEGDAKAVEPLSPSARKLLDIMVTY
jgi:hypothetical protein